MIARADNGVDVDLSLLTKVELRHEDEESPCILGTRDTSTPDPRHPTDGTARIMLLNSGELDDMRALFASYVDGLEGTNVVIDWHGLERP